MVVKMGGGYAGLLQRIAALKMSAVPSSTGKPPVSHASSDIKSLWKKGCLMSVRQQECCLQARVCLKSNRTNPHPRYTCAKASSMPASFFSVFWRVFLDFPLWGQGRIQIDLHSISSFHLRINYHQMHSLPG